MFLKKISISLFGSKIEKTRIFPVSTKIMVVFIIFILASNFTSHYISLMLNRAEMLNMLKQILIKDLKELYTFCNTQYELYQYNKDKEASLKNIEKKALNDFKKEKSIFIAVDSKGELLFQASKLPKIKVLEDKEALKLLNQNYQLQTLEGFITFRFLGSDYFGVYKHNPRWDVFLIRAEELNEFNKETQEIFYFIIVVIGIITLASAIIGIFALRYILRFLRTITDAILRMNETQQLEMIAMKNAPNDDIAFLGYAFNALSNTINNLLNIFRKFTNKDIVIKAYKEREVRLEGSKRELTCLFSDIKSFTYMTEVLGTDIIKLLNLHYNQAIRCIIEHDGIIGSIIGDALLAVYGVLEEKKGNKSYHSILSAYEIQEVAASLRTKMEQKKKKIEAERGKLTEMEERVYKAVLIQVGVGIDGGTVFYGNIGSNERMTNTVIGDNVNSASRLEGLTREYLVPVICSDYVKEDIEKNVSNHQLRFIELDTVQVKGKTIGKKIYWPIFEKDINPELEKNLLYYTKGLSLYYQGDWKQAYEQFSLCSLPPAQMFRERTKENECPKDWNGIWAMKTK